MKIVQAPNPVLSTKAKVISKIDKSILNLIKEMEKTLISAKDPEGVGLAAPQVGKSLRLFMTKLTPHSPTLVFINPNIETILEDEKGDEVEDKDSEEKKVQLEGCLSLFNIWGEVRRSPGLILSYQDKSGKIHKRKFTGFMATVIQHECDHLNGILFPKRVLEQEGQLYKSYKNDKGESEFTEIEV